MEYLERLYDRTYVRGEFDCSRMASSYACHLWYKGYLDKGYKIKVIKGFSESNADPNHAWVEVTPPNNERTWYVDPANDYWSTVSIRVGYRCETLSQRFWANPSNVTSEWDSPDYIQNPAGHIKKK